MDLPWLDPLVRRLGELTFVHAVTVVGSHASGTAGSGSDVDLFVYVAELPDEDLLGAREALADELADPSLRPIVGYPGHPNTDVWKLEAADTLLDIMFWSREWAEAELDRRLVEQEPQLGYSTAFWRSIRDGRVLFDRDGWHRALQQRARTPYPDLLRERVIALNRRAVGAEYPFSFLHQAAKAIDDGDDVAVQHGVAKWLASYFDVLFAANRVLHPGEKRLVAFARRECARVPVEFEADVTAVARISTGARGRRDISQLERALARLDTVVAELETF